MSTILTLLVPAAAVIMLALPAVPAYRGIVTGKKARRSIICNLVAFFGLCAVMTILPLGDFVTYAAGEEVATAVQGLTTGTGLGYLGAALVTGLSTVGAGIAVASAAPAAIGATSEDPKAFGKALIFVVLGEGIALYGMLVSILIINAL
ncbi:ATP synthase subunit C [Ruminococcaceae bacterium OttesenSCG-928-L11]|nr:ATP synthase subunit C [Ruminococcaceae bacterium OttesenSCG-928-L11]